MGGAHCGVEVQNGSRALSAAARLHDIFLRRPQTHFPSLKHLLVCLHYCHVCCSYVRPDESSSSSNET